MSRTNALEQEDLAYEVAMLDTKDAKLALGLIRRLRNALSQADHTGSTVNAKLIQDATDLLEKYQADGPTFTG